MNTLVCAVHGEVEALMNGKCKVCRDEQITNESVESYTRLINEKREKANIPRRHMEASLDKYIVTHEQQRNLIKDLTNWDESNIIMLGEPGTGKTYLSIAMLNKTLKIGRSGYYVKFFDLPNIQINKASLYQRIRDSYLLVIDEFGRSGSDYKSSLLFELLDKRYDDMLPTIIISNLKVTEFKQKLDNALYSRLKESHLYLNFNWEDFRNREK